MCIRDSSTIFSNGALAGEKSYVLGADRALRFVVFAQVDESKGYDGIGAFLVDKGSGVTVTARQRTLGLDAASFGGLKLENAKATRLAGPDPVSYTHLRAHETPEH